MSGSLLSRPALPRLRPRTGVEVADQLLRLAHAQSAGGNALGQFKLFGRVGDSKQCTGVAHVDTPGAQQRLHGRREFRQPNEITDRGPGSANRLGGLFVTEIELGNQAFQCLGLFQRVQVFALNVFDQRHLHRRFVVDVPHDDRYVGEPGELRGAPPPFAGNDLPGGTVPAPGGRGAARQSAESAPANEWRRPAHRAIRVACRGAAGSGRVSSLRPAATGWPLAARAWRRCRPAAAPPRIDSSTGRRVRAPVPYVWLPSRVPASFSLSGSRRGLGT